MVKGHDRYTYFLLCEKLKLFRTNLIGLRLLANNKNQIYYTFMTNTTFCFRSSHFSSTNSRVMPT